MQEREFIQRHSEVLQTYEVPKDFKNKKDIKEAQHTRKPTDPTDSRFSRISQAKQVEKEANTEKSQQETISNLGPPGSTPFARHLTPLARRLSRTAPRSERMLRRRAESQGRIHSTIFRLPQFVAQTEADRLASKTSLTPPSAEPLQPDLDTSSEQAQTDDEVVTKQPAAAEQPSTPEPAKSGWNISGIFSSVPRSFSRFLPRFGRSPARSEVPAIQQPASERIQRTRPSEASSATASEAETQSRRRSTDERPAKRARNLSFSLYPAKIDRSLYLGDVNKSTSQPAGLPPAPAPASQPVQQTSPQKTVSETSITPSEQHDDRTSRASGIASESQKKRKRSPSPDVIPNPAGSSYGMDLDYFCYSSESEDDEVTPPVPQTEPGKKAVHGKSALRDTAQTEKPVERKQKKNVHFGASPEDTPTKLRRARATDPYNGTHFIGMGGLQSASAPTTPTPASRAQDVRQRPGFAPNRSGTFELDYDAFADDSDSSGAPSPSSVPAPSPIAKTPTPAQPATPQSAPSPAPRSAARPTQATSTPARPDDDPAVAKARARIQKHAPQTPSRLRESSRYSSPIVPPDTPDITPNLTSAAAIEKVSEEFGDDQFAQEAQWLFENCPSGDFDSLKWPQPKPFGEGLNVSAEAIRIVNEIWDPADTDKAHAIFQHEFAEFKKTLT
ncbi:uncharacterized protein BDV17DRAFT_289120 [Aspergillus undulatus]|uniref:uncharacterized protein n=1 Tax=Aspergillus undulatus TaxID=1810928 RepID=UPI003CCDE580